MSDKEAEAGKQLVEHIYSLQLSRRPEVCDKVKVRKRFGDVSLRLETKGDEYNPLTSMFRTTINTIGDIAVTTALSKNEGMMDEAVYMGTAENG